MHTRYAWSRQSASPRRNEDPINTIEPAAAARSRILPRAARWVTALIMGVVIGVATSFAQKHLPGGWNALANAASPWLAGAFAAGALQRRPRAAALAGLLTCLAEVAAYYVVTPLRGYGVSTDEIVFWSACAVLGGPLLGWGGTVWWRATGRARSVGAALLPATFAGEAIGTYLLRLHHRDSALLFGVLAVTGLTVVLTGHAAGRRRARPGPVLGLAFVLTVAAALLYGPVLDVVGYAVFTG